jgi:hypothetical protein
MCLRAVEDFSPPTNIELSPKGLLLALNVLAMVWYSVFLQPVQMLIYQQQHNTSSEYYFKHIMYGIRYLFRLEGFDDKRVSLPTIERQEKLPVVLSRQEMKALLKSTCPIKASHIAWLAVRLWFAKSGSTQPADQRC